MAPQGLESPLWILFKGGEGWNKTDLVFSSFLNYPLMRTAFPWEMKPVQHSAFLV